MSRNAAAMHGPEAAAVFLAAIVGCGVCWWAAYRGKSSAVASAVATAVASARAESNASAAAVATQAVTLVLNGYPQDAAVLSALGQAAVPSVGGLAEPTSLPAADAPPLLGGLTRAPYELPHLSPGQAVTFPGFTHRPGRGRVDVVAEPD